MAAAGPALALAQQPAAAPPDGWTWSLDGATQGVVSFDPFWGLAQTFVPQAGYASDARWVEVYLRPAVRGERALDGIGTLHGGVSLVGAATLGTDLFEEGDTGRLLVDEAFVGVRRALSGDAGVALSAGAQRYVLAQGMLLAQGAANGFERGAATLAPRKAWGMTTVARAWSGPSTAEAFYLDPDELASADSGTRLGGGRLEWSPSPTGAIGVAYVKVLRSTTPYPKVPAEVIDGGREGLETVDLHGRWAPTAGPWSGLSVSGEFALQRNDRIWMKARGFAGEIAYRFEALPWRPRLAWSPRYFSGDDPATPDRLERFDPLFYDPAVGAWSAGGNGSFAFYNSNLLVHRLRLDLALSPVDLLSVSGWLVRAAKTDSPLQYGQAARLVPGGGGLVLVSGVPERPLSREVYVEYTRVLSAHWFLTAGLAIAVPDSGIEAIVPSGAKTWTGALLNLAFRY